MSTITVRASSWGSLFDCAYKWEGEHLLGYRKPSGLRATLGTAVHAGTAAFDEAKLAGTPISPDAAAGVFIDKLRNPDDAVDYKVDRSITMKEAEIVGLTLTTKYCNEISPRYTFRAVEMKMNALEVDCGNGITIRLTGTMDRARVLEVPQIQLIAEDDQRYGPKFKTVIADIKTGTRLIENGAVLLKGRSAQLGAYQLMYEDTTGEPTDGAQIIALPTSGKPEPALSPIWDARQKMIGTATAPGFIELAARMFKDGFFPPNPLSPLCSSKYCARWEACQYHD